ncbi:MAG: sensor histidine kinase [Candidatus Nitrosopolaris sp.]
MIKKERIRKTNIVILALTAAVALILSIFAYQYSTFTSNKIIVIASQEVRSNARIEVHDVSQILANKLQTVGALLQTLTESPAINNNEYKRADIVINSRQHSSSDLTDFYMWLDKNGKINWISNINETTYQKYKGTDLSYRPYFTIPKYTHTVYYSSLIQSNDKVPRLYISYPVINMTGTVTSMGTFSGVVVASIRLETLGNFLKNQILPQFNSTIGLLDRNGIILYTTPKQFGITTNTQQYVGEYVFGDKFQSVLSSSLQPPASKNLINDLIKKSLQGNTGSGDILINGKMNTIAYQPVVIADKNFLTLYISAQHTLTSDVSALIDQQRYFTILVVTIIAAVAFIIEFLLFSWNKRLETTVNVRTAELKTANDSLAKSNKQLASANEELKIHDKMQNEFINIASHELRTPAQSILAYAELAKADPPYIENQIQPFIDVIYRNAFRIQKLTNDILDVTRIESKTLSLNKTKFNLKDVIVSAVEDVQAKLVLDGNNKVKVVYRSLKDREEVDDRDDNFFVQADRDKITQVISNLLNNAVKFTTRGLVSIAVSGKKVRKEGQEGAIVTIEDPGSGIDAEIFPRLFTKFSSKSFSGTGLGLYISKNIIEAHGGKIWAENNNGQGKCGATFSFSLPLYLGS